MADAFVISMGPMGCIYRCGHREYLNGPVVPVEPDADHVLSAMVRVDRDCPECVATADDD